MVDHHKLLSSVAYKISPNLRRKHLKRHNALTIASLDIFCVANAV